MGQNLSAQPFFAIQRGFFPLPVSYIQFVRLGIFFFSNTINNWWKGDVDTPSVPSRVRVYSVMLATIIFDFNSSVRASRKKIVVLITPFISRNVKRRDSPISWERSRWKTTGKWKSPWEFVNINDDRLKEIGQREQAARGWEEKEACSRLPVRKREMI